MIKNHSMTILGHRTSITLEEEFYTSLRHIAEERSMSMASLVAEIEQNKEASYNLSSAIRVFILNYYKTGDEKAS